MTFYLSLHRELDRLHVVLCQHRARHLGGYHVLNVDVDAMVRIVQLLTLIGLERELKGELHGAIRNLARWRDLNLIAEQLYRLQRAIKRFEKSYTARTELQCRRALNRQLDTIMCSLAL